LLNIKGIFLAIICSFF